MNKQTFEPSFLPGTKVEIAQGDSSFSEGLPEGYIRVNFLNAAGGVSSSSTFPPPPLPES